MQRLIGISLRATVFFGSAVVFLGGGPAEAYQIKFDLDGIFKHIFGPPDGTGAIEYRTGAPKSTSIQIVSTGFPVPADRGGTNLGAVDSPIELIDGTPGTARVITDLAIGHGQSLGNLESDGSKPPPQGFTGPPGTLEQSFSATGFWRVIREATDTLPLKWVALSGSLRGDVRLDPPLFGTAEALVAGSIRVDPFGSFAFSTNKQTSSSGSLGVGIGIKEITGDISFTPPSVTGSPTLGTVAFTDIDRSISLDTPYEFSLSGSLSAQLSSFGITGTAFSIANLWTQQFELAPVPCRPTGGAFLILNDVPAESCFDYGDAPESYGTLLPSGPRYEEGHEQRLGRLWDTEPDGQPSPNADGDDLNGGCSQFACFPPDDEDGVIFGANSVDVAINVDRDGENDYGLRAWWDLNENGIFDHASELMMDEILKSITPGQYTRHYDLGFNPKDYYSRFRLTWIDDPLGENGGVSFATDVRPTGEYLGADGISHGEVEDYAPVPGPLPLLGVGAAFGFSRKLRKRIKTSKTPEVLSTIG
jgi:hypothetical protein